MNFPFFLANALTPWMFTWAWQGDFNLFQSPDFGLLIKKEKKN
jgi:hypothetical protein